MSAPPQGISSNPLNFRNLFVSQGNWLRLCNFFEAPFSCHYLKLGGETRNLLRKTPDFLSE